MENIEIKLCRLCNKEGFVFCDIYDESFAKITTLIPNLIDINDTSLEHITKICPKCYQNVRTITFQIECIKDTQKILKIENAMRPKISKEIPIKIEDLTRKYTSIKVKRVSMNSPEKNIAVKEELSGSKIVVIEALPKQEVESPKKKSRCLMCISCSQKFTDFDEMQLHLISCKSSSNDANLKCFCGKVMSSRKNLELHVYTQHKDNKRKHICTICQKVFTSLFNLQNHMVIHKGLHSNKIIKTNEV